MKLGAFLHPLIRPRALRVACLGLVCLGLAISTPACGGASSGGAAGGGDAEEHSLTEGRALAILLETLSEAGLEASGGWSVEIGPGESLEVDLRLSRAGSSEASLFGVEWVSEQDRRDHGEALPHPAPDGQIRVVHGGGADREAQILLLEHDTYTYVRGRERGEEASAEDAEARLRRDLRDFLQYARTEGLR